MERVLFFVVIFRTKSLARELVIRNTYSAPAWGMAAKPAPPSRSHARVRSAPPALQISLKRLRIASEREN